MIVDLHLDRRADRRGGRGRRRHRGGRAEDPRGGVRRPGRTSARRDGTPATFTDVSTSSSRQERQRFLGAARRVTRCRPVPPTSSSRCRARSTTSAGQGRKHERGGGDAAQGDRAHRMSSAGSRGSSVPSRRRAVGSTTLWSPTRPTSPSARPPGSSSRPSTPSSRWPGRPGQASRRSSTTSAAWTSRPSASSARRRHGRSPARGDRRAPTSILDWLGIPKRHQISRMGLLDESAEDRDLQGLVLLDLPDHDSTEVSHHLEVERLVKFADVLHLGARSRRSTPTRPSTTAS